MENIFKDDNLKKIIESVRTDLKDEFKPKLQLQSLYVEEKDRKSNIYYHIKLDDKMILIRVIVHSNILSGYISSKELDDIKIITNVIPNK